MRILVLALTLLVPAVSSAQVVAAPLGAVPEANDLDLAPVMIDNQTLGLLVLGGLAGLAIFLIQLEGTDFNCGEAALTTAGTLLVCGGVAYCMYGGGITESSMVTADSGVAYPADALSAFLNGELTAGHRERLATAARDAGRQGVVLRRLVQAPAGVGEQAGGVRLEVSVVDAETGRFRALGEDVLGTVTVLSVPVGDDLAAASDAALTRIGG